MANRLSRWVRDNSNQPYREAGLPASQFPLIQDLSPIFLPNIPMTFQLINGHFSPKEAIDILTKMTQVKVRYHEQQISDSDHEEDVKTREKRIKNLQNNLQEARQQIEKSGLAWVGLQADVLLTFPE